MGPDPQEATRTSSQVTFTFLCLTLLFVVILCDLFVTCAMYASQIPCRAQTSNFLFVWSTFFV